MHYKPGRVKEKFGAAGFSKWEPLIWHDRGRLPRRRWYDVFQSMPFQNRLPVEIDHRWGKDPDAVAAVVEHFSKPGEVVFDPFAGSGVVSVACKMLGRHSIGFEIERSTAALARMNLLKTPDPLFVVPPRQLEMAIDG